MLKGLQLTPAYLTLALLFTAAGLASNSQFAVARGARIMPPAAITCDRNQLTSWSGRISGYKRNGGASWIEIHTDADTVESIAIEHPGTSDPSAHFLLLGKPFVPETWTDIETSPSHLKENMRATIWICLDDATPPVVDWRPGEPPLGIPQP